MTNEKINVEYYDLILKSNGRLGERRRNNMLHNFKYVSKRSAKVRAAYNDLMVLLQEVRNDLKEYTFQHKVVGSYSRDMMTYDEKSNVGFDFDVNIYPNFDKKGYTAKDIKLFFKKALDKHVKKHGFDYAEDSTRVLTIKVKDTRESRIIYSIDFAFVYDLDNNGKKCQLYIHYNKKQNTYELKKQPSDYYELAERVDWIKKNGLWDSELKPLYLKKKNENSKQSVHSRQIFSMTVNEICMKYGFENNTIN